MTNTKKTETKKLVLGAILTAMVVILQYMGSFIRLGPFSISLVLVPIVIGAVECGVGVGAWLGLVFGAIVLAMDSGAFLAVNVPGTIITVLSKGILCGLVAGLTYKGAMKAWNNKLVAVVLSAIICPVVNTGVFVIGCFLFFLETLKGWAGGGNVIEYIFIGMIGFNFILEIAINVILSPVITKLLNIRQKIQ